jgi:hypothetical protein
MHDDSPRQAKDGPAGRNPFFRGLTVPTPWHREGETRGRWQQMDPCGQRELQPPASPSIRTELSQPELRFFLRTRNDGGPIPFAVWFAPGQ